MSLNSLEPIYFSNEQDLDKELFLPILKKATSCQCMTGYFTSGALSELAHSLSYFLTADSHSLEFLVSPNLVEQDVNAIKSAMLSDDNLIPLLFPNFELSEHSLKTKTIEALSYLVATKKLEIRLALQLDGIFHTKCWLFDTCEGKIAVHGSGNATKNGLSINFEQLTVSRSWLSDESKKVVERLKNRYLKLWSGEYEGIETSPLNEKTIKYLADIYQDIKYKSSEDVSESLQKFLKKKKKEADILPKLIIPNWLNYTSGDYAHQGKAIKAWNANKGHGILSIATGGGKTLTSLVAATLVSNKEDNLLLVIAVPTKALLSQWVIDVELFNVTPLNTSGTNSTIVAQKINESIRRIKFKSSKDEVVLLTHESLKNKKILKVLEKASKAFPIMLIGDEVHNLGSIGFQKVAPDFFKYRLGLSATAERQTDEEGTNFLITYFGDIVFDFSLKDAIGVCLVPYTYHVHIVQLDEDEADEWAELTYQIKKLSFASEFSDDTPEKTRWKILCLKRRRIIESAIGKVAILANILPKKSHELKRALIFCTDKYPEQLNNVNKLLIRRGIRFHQVTSSETKNKKKLEQIISSFSNDKIQVLTSKRVLDEGFNVPQTEVAYLLASNTIRRQWIQRLGRVLRKSSVTNKVTATIHDFIVTPPTSGGIDTDLKALVKGELSRIQYFDNLSSNGLENHGTADIVEELLEMIGAL